jgi:hypothetical protein
MQTSTRWRWGGADVGLPKFTGPLAPPPSWLDPAAEAKGWAKPSIPTELFEPYVVDKLLGHGLVIVQALDVGANVVSEIGWDESFAFHNAGGVKATKPWAERYKARTGKSAGWWRTHGNSGSGDSHTVFYRAYPDFDGFLEEWLLTFIPKPGTVGATHLYKRTGELFWSGQAWFRALVAAGYNGAVSAAKPEGSIDAHASIMRRLTVVWAQARLGLVVDAKWGPKSDAALAAFAAKHGSTASLADQKTLAKLVENTAPRVL